jgi:LacI family transcriptional regulator
MAALCEELGKSVPQDVSVIGFDDVPSAQDVTPALTTVRLPLEEMGERAMRLLLEPADRGPRTIRVKADLVVRQSTTSVT